MHGCIAGLLVLLMAGCGSTYAPQSPKQGAPRPSSSFAVGDTHPECANSTGLVANDGPFIVSTCLPRCMPDAVLRVLCTDTGIYAYSAVPMTYGKTQEREPQCPGAWRIWRLGRSPRVAAGRPDSDFFNDQHIGPVQYLDTGSDCQYKRPTLEFNWFSRPENQSFYFYVMEEIPE